MNKTVFALVAAAGLAGCSLIDLATQTRPHGAQKDAIPDLFDQAATVAITFDDPANASSDDLRKLITFDHFVFMVAPELAPGASGAPRLSDESALECITQEGNTLTASACAVVLPDGRNCIVDGSFSSSPSGDGTRYQGNATMAGAGCPASTVSLDATLVGPSDMPTQLTAQLDVDTNDGDTVFSGSATFDVAVSGSCTVPSKGTIDISASGTYKGSPFDGALQLEFHETPECGYISINN